MTESFYSRYGKRCLDATIGFVGLVALSPVFLLVALAVFVSGGTPIFFRHARAGRFGACFSMLKFRTMIHAGVERGARITAAGDPRVTALGRLLRRSKIDELPQLFNVLLGQMSVVGPRPEIPAFTTAYTERQRQVLLAKPGITGPATIAFAREEELLAKHADPEKFYLKSVLPTKLELDVAYCHNITFQNDVKLIFRTVAAIFDLKTAAQTPSRKQPEVHGPSSSSETMSDPGQFVAVINGPSPSSGPAPRATWKRFDPYSRTNQFILESCVFGFALIAAYAIRFEGWPSGPDLRQLVFWLPILVLGRVAVHYAMGVYRIVWRFVSLADALEVAKSTGTVTLALLAVRLLTPGHGAVAELVRLPLSVIILEGLLSLTGSLGIRALRRLQYNHQRRVAGLGRRPPRRVLLYGAGRAGILLRRELETNTEYQVIGFVDDDPMKLGGVICNTRVLGSGEDLGEMVARWSIQEVVISMATASRQTLIRVLAKCRSANVSAKIIPSLHEILERRAPISELREPRAEELLGREHVEVAGFEAATRSVYTGKRVLVTGGGGSIGSEVVRQLVRLEPGRVAILDKDENSVYELEQELLFRRSGVQTEPLIADIRDPRRLRAIFADFQPEIVFHAAAHKHVPLMERHPCEAILNNVVGTRNVLEAAAEARVERLVFISSDKAVNPVNVMGATKRIGELMVQSFAASQSVPCACVRFGNVLGSRGSVLPLFKRQIAEGGPVTITHPDIVRFFMTIQEAVQLILCAGTLANSGEIFVLDMGTPRSILDLAKETILLCGLTPGTDIETTFTGLRPGEKLYEELVGPSETLRKTHFEKLSVIESSESESRDLSRDVAGLLDSAVANDQRKVYEILSGMGLGFVRDTPRARAAAATASD